MLISNTLEFIKSELIIFYRPLRLADVNLAALKMQSKLKKKYNGIMRP